MSDIYKIRLNGVDYDIGNKRCNAQTIHVDEGDVILLHLHENADVEDMRMIHSEVKKIFPNNDILIFNENILKGLTILKPTKKAINAQEIEESTLSEWLNQHVEFNL